MYVDLHINEPFSVKKGLTASAKGTGQGQPAQSRHALIHITYLVPTRVIKVSRFVIQIS